VKDNLVVFYDLIVFKKEARGIAFGSFYIASSLKQQSVGRHVAPLGYIILILSQLIFALTPQYAAWLVEKQ
jgi:hypothetical protein